MIDNRIWQSEKFSRLDLGAQVLFIGMVTTADDQGRGRAHANLLRSTIMPYTNYEAEEIEFWLQQMVERQMVIVYIPDGTPALYQIKKWWELQTLQYAQPSDYPPPPDWQDRIAFKPFGGTMRYRNWPNKEDTAVDRTVASTVGTTIGTTVGTTIGTTIGTTLAEVVVDETETENETEEVTEVETEEATETDQPSAAADSISVYDLLQSLGVQDPAATNLAAEMWVDQKYVREWWAYISSWPGTTDEARIKSLICRIRDRRQVPPEARENG